MKVFIFDSKKNTKNDVFREIDDFCKSKNLNLNNVYEKLLEREEISSTGFENGIAIPHGMIDNLNEEVLVVVRTNKIDWNSLDKGLTELAFCLLIPSGGENHLNNLSTLAKKMGDSGYIEKLKSLDNNELLKEMDSLYLEEEPMQNHSQANNGKKFLAITKCPVGIAHTYIAAEKLEGAAKKLGYEIKVETQGSQGVENKITNADLKNCDGVIISADATVDELERFNGLNVLKTDIKSAIRTPEELFEKVLTAPVQSGDKFENKAESGEKESLVKYVMNGVSFMIPFVVVGGLFIALALSMGGTPTPEGIIIPEDSAWKAIEQIGVIGFTLMIPILAGYTAYGIAGRAALAPAMIAAMIANNPALLGTEAGTGFLGALLVGILTGYLVRWMNTWKIPKVIKPIMPIFVIPILGTVLIGGLFILVLGQPISFIMTELNNMLTYMASVPQLAIPLGFLLGAMLAFDMGGPVNKVAFLFGVASISAGNPEVMGAVACAGAVPPLSCGLATIVQRKRWNEEEQGAGIAALLMGLIGITEGAIPFAAGNPKAIMPAIMLASGIAGALGMIFGITCMVPHTGPIVGLLGATNNLPLFLAIITVSSILGCIFILLFKKKENVTA